MGEVDTSTEALDASIDASLEQQLEMSAQFGSQAETLMNQLHTAALEASEDFEEEMLEIDPQMQADAFAEMESDYDMLVGGMQREMMLNQQATMSSIQHQQAATQNYMDMMSAALPALEARMAAQVESARTAGSGYSSGPSGPAPYPFDEDDEDGDDTTTEGDDLIDVEAGDYDELWGQQLTDEDKMDLAREIGMDPHDLWGEPRANFFDVNIDNPDRQKWFHEDLAEQLGINIDSLDEAYNRIWWDQTEITPSVDEETGEGIGLITKKPHWFHQKGLATMNSWIANGMDPLTARTQAFELIKSEMEEQYANDEIVHDPEKFEGWVNDLDFILSYNYQGTLHQDNQPFDMNDLGGTGWRPDGFAWKDAGVTTVTTEFYDAYREAQKEDQQLSEKDFGEEYWEGKEEDKKLFDSVRADLGERTRFQEARDQTRQDPIRKLDPARQPTKKPDTKPQSIGDVWDALAKAAWLDENKDNPALEIANWIGDNSGTVMPQGHQRGDQTVPEGEPDSDALQGTQVDRIVRQAEQSNTPMFQQDQTINRLIAQKESQAREQALAKTRGSGPKRSGGKPDTKPQSIGDVWDALANIPTSRNLPDDTDPILARLRDAQGSNTRGSGPKRSGGKAATKPQSIGDVFDFRKWF